MSYRRHRSARAKSTNATKGHPGSAKGPFVPLARAEGPKQAFCENVVRTPDRRKRLLDDLHRAVADFSASRRADIVDEAEDIPTPYLRTYTLAVTGGSKRAAVLAMCLRCVSWKRKEVEMCPSLACPLWDVRPFQE